MSFHESNYENAVIAVLEEIGYTHRYGPDITRDYRNPLYMDALMDALPRVNPGLPSAAIEEALHKLTHLEHGSVVQQNRQCMDWLQNGVEVSFQLNGETRSELVRLVDYQHPERNSFYAVNQWTVQDIETRRADVVLFINGLPLVLVELKSCSREDTDVREGYNQIQRYLYEVPSLFPFNAFCIISDLAHTKAGTITAGYDRFMEWKTIDGDILETQAARYDVLLRGMLAPARFLELIKYFMLYFRSGDKDIKILAAYHQYYAVKKAVESTRHASIAEGELRGKGGVFWHTQGSGKSLSMVFYARLLQDALDSPTLVVITDRNDLDEQLFAQFAACSDFLRQTPEHAKDRLHLTSLLAGRVANGIFFTTMFKFEELGEPMSDRRNIVVMADEAHRSQYGLTERVKENGTVITGAARIVRNSLPNATYIGFTGTPVSSKDRNTREVFGDYIDVYDMTQAVADGATRPVYYESRVINLGLDEDILRQIDAKYDELALEAEETDIARSKRNLGNIEKILGAEPTIDSLCHDIIEHYEQNRENLLTGKAMIVGYSRGIALSIYRKLLALRPDWTEKVKVVMTPNPHKDSVEDQKIIGSNAYRKALAVRFKDNEDPFKVVIVVDMWLTGFDVPSLATMYVYKPMNGHNLMQAIARVNRVFQDKEGGLVVDYIGIARALKEAMRDYTVRDQQKYGEMDIAKTALPLFIEKMQVCGELLHPFDYSIFVTSDSDSVRGQTIMNGVNHILGMPEDMQKLFRKEALALHQAMSLCQSLLSKPQRMEGAYFEVLRVVLGRMEPGKKLSYREINGQISELLHQSIRSEGVINLFSDVNEDFSLFDQAFLADVAKMQQKNLAAELLKKLLSEQIRLYERTNLVQAERFSDRMQKIMNQYRNGLIKSAEVIDELIQMAMDIGAAQDEGESLGLTREEKAFYDALTKPDAVRDFYTNDQLKEMTRRLTDELRKSRTVDWQKKESARAGMRRLVKRLLREFDYPPEGRKDALETLMRQCERWADMEAS